MARPIRRIQVARRAARARQSGFGRRVVDEAKVLAAATKLGLNKTDLIRLAGNTAAGRDYKGWNPELLVIGLKEAHRLQALRRKSGPRKK